MQAEYMTRAGRRRAAASLAATATLAVAMLPADARGEVVPTHQVTHQIVTPHPQVAPSTTGSAPDPGTASGPGQSAGASQASEQPSVGQDPQPQPFGGGAGPDQEDGHYIYPPRRWAWAPVPQDDGSPDRITLIPWVGPEPPLFGYAPDRNWDGEKVPPNEGVAAELQDYIVLLSKHVNQDLLAPHMPVAIPPATDSRGPNFSTEVQGSGPAAGPDGSGAGGDTSTGGDDSGAGAIVGAVESLFGIDGGSSSGSNGLHELDQPLAAD